MIQSLHLLCTLLLFAVRTDAASEEDYRGPLSGKIGCKYDDPNDETKQYSCDTLKQLKDDGKTECMRTLYFKFKYKSDINVKLNDKAHILMKGKGIGEVGRDSGNFKTLNVKEVKAGREYVRNLRMDVNICDGAVFARMLLSSGEDDSLVIRKGFGKPLCNNIKTEVSCTIGDDECSKYKADKNNCETVNVNYVFTVKNPYAHLLRVKQSTVARIETTEYTSCNSMRGKKIQPYKSKSCSKTIAINPCENGGKIPGMEFEFRGKMLPKTDLPWQQCVSGSDDETDSKDKDKEKKDDKNKDDKTNGDKEKKNDKDDDKKEKENKEKKDNGDKEKENKEKKDDDDGKKEKENEQKKDDGDDKKEKEEKKDNGDDKKEKDKDDGGKEQKENKKKDEGKPEV